MTIVRAAPGETAGPRHTLYSIFISLKGLLQYKNTLLECLSRRNNNSGHLINPPNFASHPPCRPCLHFLLMLGLKQLVLQSQTKKEMGPESCFHARHSVREMRNAQWNTQTEVEGQREGSAFCRMRQRGVS